MKAYKYYGDSQAAVTRAARKTNSRPNRPAWDNREVWRHIKLAFFGFFGLLFLGMAGAGTYFPQWYETSGMACLAQIIGSFGGSVCLVMFIKNLILEPEEPQPRAARRKSRR